MRIELRNWWESRSPRDRRILAVLGALVALLLYLALVQSAYRARAQLGASLDALRAQSLRLREDATEIARIRAMQVPPVGQTDLRSQLQVLVSAAGLSGGLLRIDASGADQAQVAFSSVAFAEWLQWIATLQAQRIRLESSRIEALSAPGMVGVTATFARARMQ